MIQIILIVLIILIVAGMATAFVVNNQNQRRARVVGLIKGKATGKAKVQQDKEDQDKRRAEISKKLQDTKKAKDEDKDKKKTTISDMILQAGITISVKQFWLMSLVSFIVCTFLAMVLSGAPFIVTMAAVIGFFGVPRFVLKNMAAKRQKAFLEEFADGLEAMVRLLKAGMPVSEAIAMVSKEFTGPLGEEMSKIYDKQKIGVPLHEAALESTRAMPLTEMNMFATGLAIQAQTGASLSEVLTNLAGVIRARFRLKRKVKALASEAVASASIIGALPIIVAGGMWFVNRDYINLLFTDPTGKVLLAGAVIWMCIGIMVMRAMINFKV